MSEEKNGNNGKNYFPGILTSLLFGLSAGFILGILFAPKSGKETRKEIKEKSEELIKKSKNSLDEIAGKTKDYVDKTKATLAELKSKGEDFVENGEDFSEIFMQKRAFNNLRLEDGKIENSTSGNELGCGLRLWAGESTFYAYVDSLKEDKLLNAAKVLSSAVNGSSHIKILNLTETSSSYNINVKKIPSTINPDNKKNILETIDRDSRNSSSNVIQVTSFLSDVEEQIFTANSYGFFSLEEAVKTFLGVNVVAKRGKNIGTG